MQSGNNPPSNGIDFNQLANQLTTSNQAGNKIIGQQPTQQDSGISSLMQGLNGFIQGLNKAKNAPAGQPQAQQAAQQAGVIPTQQPSLQQQLQQAVMMQTPADMLQHTMNGIANNETGGSQNPYQEVSIPSGNGDKAYGKYQIMGANIPQWTKEALGTSMTPEEFMKSPQAQEATAANKMGQLLQQYKNPADVASVWFTGKPTTQVAWNTRDAYGTTARDYVGRFHRGYTDSFVKDFSNKMKARSSRNTGSGTVGGGFNGSFNPTGSWS